MELMTMDEYNQKSGTGVDYDTFFQGDTGANPQNQQAVDSDAWVYKTEDASMLDTLGKKFSAAKSSLLTSALPENIEEIDPELSNFANNLQRIRGQEYREASEKLGIVGNVGVGLATLPAIAGAGVAGTLAGGPLAGLAAGGLASTALYTGETLAEQAREGQRGDLGDALKVGVASGITDMALGGLGNVARAGLAAKQAGRAGVASQSLVAPTAFQRGKSAIAQAAPGVGINAVEDATSAVAGNAYTNLALGRDWHEGMAEAALGGAVAGGAVRGGMAGFNKAMNIAPNKAGETTLQDMRKLRDEDGLVPDNDMLNNTYEINNADADLVSKINNAGSVEERNALIQSRIGMSENAGDAATALALKMMKAHKLPMLNNGFNVPVTKGLSKEGDTKIIGHQMGLDDKSMIKHGYLPTASQHGRFGKEKASKEGLTTEADAAQFKKAYDVAVSDMRKPMQDNLAMVENMLDVAARTPDVDPQRLKSLEDLTQDLRAHISQVNQYAGSKKENVSGMMKVTSRRVMENASNLGIMNQLKGMDGAYNPLVDAMALDRFVTMAKERLPGLENTTTNPYSNKYLAGKGDIADAMLVAGLATPMAPAALVGLAGRNIAAEWMGKNTRGKLKKGKAETSNILSGVANAMKARDTLAANKKAAMEAGDASTAADISTAQLADSGIPVDSVAKGVDDVIAQMDQPVPTPAEKEASRSAPLAARDPRQLLTKEEVLAIDEVAKTDPVGAEELAQQIIAQKSDPVPTRVPQQPQPAPEVAPEAPVAGSDSTGMLGNPKPQPEPEISPAALQEDVNPATLSEPEEIAAVQEIAKTDPAGAGELVQQFVAEKSKPVPVSRPDPRTPVEEQAPAPVAEPAPKERVDLVTEPKKKVEEEAIEPVVDPEIEAARLAEVEAAAKAEQEAARKASKEATQGMRDKPKQPQAEEPEVAPAKAEEVSEPKVEEPRASATDMVRKPLRKMAEDFSNMSNAKKEQMLNAEPTKYHEMERAKSDLKEMNTIISKVSSQLGTSDEVISQIVSDLGGMKGIRSKANDPETDISPQVYVHNQARDLIRLKKSEAKDKMEDIRSTIAQQRETPKVDIAEKQISTREELLSLGFSKDNVDQAFDSAGVKSTTDDFDPKIVRNWARTQQRQRLDEANALAREAAMNARKAAQASKKSTSEVMPEGERARLETDIREQLDAYKGVIADKKSEAKSKIEARSKVKELEKSLENVTTKQAEVTKKAKEAEDKAAQAAEAMEATKAEAEKLKKSSEKLSKLPDVKSSKATSKEVQAKAAPEVAKLGDVELEALASEATTPSNAIKDYSDPEVKGLHDAIADELKIRGEKDAADYMSTFNDIVAKAEERKKKHPDNKEYWILGDEKQKLQELMQREGNKGGSSYMGNLQKQLALRFFGDAESGEKYIRLSQSEIDSRIAKGALGSEDIVVKKKPMKIGRKIEK